MDQNLKPEKYKLTSNYFFRTWLALLWGVQKFLEFFSLRQGEKYWGVVYDSVSKQPLDPAIIKLLYVDGSEVETRVTDMEGRYGFLAKPGKFKIFAKKTNYTFPSKYAAGESDGIYEDLYHGEFFELYGDYEVVAPNIPMDPQHIDWNQQAKTAIVNSRPYLKKFFKSLVAIIFWFGLIWAGFRLWQGRPGLDRVAAYSAAAYFAVFLFGFFAPNARLWGRLKTKGQAEFSGILRLELNHPKLQTTFGRAVVADTGRFLLRANKGRYLLNLYQLSRDGSSKELLAKKMVRVGSSGVYNGTLTLKAKH